MGPLGMTATHGHRRESPSEGRDRELSEGGREGEEGRTPQTPLERAARSLTSILLLIHRWTLGEALGTSFTDPEMVARWGPHMSDWMLASVGSLRAPSQIPKDGRPVWTVACTQHPRPPAPGQFSFGCAVLTLPPNPLPQRTFPQWGRVWNWRDSCLHRGAAEQKCGCLRYQRGAWSWTDPELALCLWSLTLSRVWLSYASVPGCGSLSGWPCQSGALWNLEKVWQNLQNSVSLCPCYTHTHPLCEFPPSCPVVPKARNLQEAISLAPSSKVLCF